MNKNTLLFYKSIECINFKSNISNNVTVKYIDSTETLPKTSPTSWGYLKFADLVRLGNARP